MNIFIKARGVLAACTTVVLLASCHDFLDIKPYGKAIPETTDDFSAILNDLLMDIDGNASSTTLAHKMFLDNDEVEDFETACDNLETNLTQQPLGSYLKFYFGDILDYAYYKDLYATIGRCNIVLDEYEDGRDTREGKDLLGTIYALRGTAYYQLLRMYCAPVGQENQELGVPIVTDFDMEAKVPRGTVEQTIEQSESDLKTALDYDNQNEMYRFNKDVINACLSRLYFWAGRWSEAKALADSVLARHPLLSGDEYKKMVTAETGIAGNMLLRVGRFTNTSYMSFETINRFLSARPFSTRFLKLFPEKGRDIRYGLWIKAGRKNNKVFISSIRSAELALISMECAYHLGNTDEALRELNDFRDHRITDNVHYTMSSLPAVDTSEIIQTDAEGKALTPLIQAILNERRKELYMENGDRFFELKRNGRPEFWIVNRGLKYTNKKFMYTFPLPPNDVRLNPGLVQNPGYTEVTYD